MKSKGGAERSEKSKKLPITSLFFLTYRFLSPILVPVNARNAPGAPRGRLLHPIPTADFLSAHGSAAVRIAATGIAAKRLFRQTTCKTGDAPSGSAKPANSLFFPPNRRKRVAERRAKAQGIISFYAGFCVTIGKALRTAAVPKSQPVQGVARSAAAPRPAVPAFFFEYGTICPVEGNGSRSCFLAPFAGIGY